MPYDPNIHYTTAPGSFPYPPPQQLGHAQQRQAGGQADYQPASQASSNIHSQPVPQQRYQQAVNYAGTPYSTPQYQVHSSFYQTPQSAQYSQQSARQPYLSPPNRPNQIQEDTQYSPDSSQYCQAQSHPRQSQAQGRQQQNQHQHQHQHQQRQPPQRTPTHSSHQPRPPPVAWQDPPPPQEWTNFNPDQQAPGHQVQRQQNAQSFQQNQQQTQRRPSQARPPSATFQRSSIGVAQPSPQPAPQSLQRRPSPNLTRPPSSSQPQRQAPQVSQSHQIPQSPRQPHAPSRAPLVGQVPPTPAAAPQQQAQHQPQPQHQPPPMHPPGTVDPSMVQRRVLTPMIPVQQASSKAQQPKYASSAPTPKRRRSNDGQAIPVCEPPEESQQPSRSQRVKQPAATSSPLTELASSQFPPTPTLANIDYQAVLLNLSNEYISAAYSMSSSLATPEVSEEELDDYHSLLSTGMGCLESALKNFRAMDARMEARIRLRLASLLYEETDNDTEAEEILSKGLTACERARLPELKYAMLHLLARLWYKGGKSKAAMKAVEKHITEVEKLNLVHWIYAFRFLRVSLGLQADNSYVEATALVRQLTAIHAVAARQQDVAVQIVASTMEALIHLRSRTPDSVDLAQRALAAGRMHQTSPEMASMPQARALLNYIDLGCSIMHFNPEQVAAKMHLMQGDLDSANRDSTWCADGSWHIQLGSIRTSSTNIEADTGGVVRMFNGKPSLVFKWFTKIQAYILGFLFSSLSSMHKNASTEQKAEAHLDEALKLSKIPIESALQSISAASTQYNTQRLLRVNLRLYVVFAFCGRSEWDKALKGIENIRKDIDELEEDPGADIMSLIAYLEAVCKHGLADLKGALKLYHSPQLRVPPQMHAKAAAGSVNPIRVLAALNSILIMRHFGKRDEADRLLTVVEPACHTHNTSYGGDYGNRAIESAFMILKATEPPNRAADNLILKTKQHLQVAVTAGKIAYNNQLLCIVMSIMTDLFFHNIVGDQAEKSARAGRTLAKKSQDKLWTAVANGMYGNTLEKCGKAQEAAAVRREAQEAMERMPESLKGALLADEMDESS